MSEFPIEDLSTDLKRFQRHSAAIQQMDLVISVDTAVAHLAGAMAKPFGCYYRRYATFGGWNRAMDSPWYPTMRLFRQERRGDWDSVVRDVEAALKQRVAGPTGPAIVSDARGAMAVATGERGPSPGPQPDARYSAVAETRVGVIHYLPNDLPIADSIRWYGEYLQPMIDDIVRLMPVGRRFSKRAPASAFMRWRWRQRQRRRTAI
jgi:hypothetical protein